VTSARTAARSVFIVGSAALVVAVSWRFMDLLGDSFWTMALGRTILATRTLPAQDPFAYTSVHERYFVQMPATAVLFAWLAAHAGLAAVAATAALVQAAAWIIAWLGSSRGSRGAVAQLVALPAVLLGEFLGRGDLCARGQVFGSLGFAILLVLVDRVRRGRAVHGIAPFALAAAWANLHPSFVLAVAVPLACAAMTYVDPPDERTPARPLLRLAAWASAGMLVTPYGPGLLLDVMKLMRDPTTAELDLFQSPNFRSFAWLVLVVLTLTAMSLRASYGPTAGRASDVALMAVLLAAACGARRYGDLLWLTVVFQLGRSAGDAVEGHAAVAAALAARFAVQAAFAMAGVELAAATALVTRPRDFLFQVPAGATAFVQNSGHGALPDHVYAPYHWGGYLDWAFDGRRKVFIDGRNMLFHNGVIEDALAIQTAQPGWSQLLESYAIETLITERWSRLEAAVANDPAWQPLFQDERASVYVKKPRSPG